MSALVPALAGIFLAGTALVAGGLLVLPIIRSTLAARRSPEGKSGGRASKLSTQEDAYDYPLDIPEDTPASYDVEGYADHLSNQFANELIGAAEEAEKKGDGHSEEGGEEEGEGEDDGWIENEMQSPDPEVGGTKPQAASLVGEEEEEEAVMAVKASVARATKPLDLDEFTGAFKYKHYDLE